MILFSATVIIRDQLFDIMGRGGGRGVEEFKNKIIARLHQAKKYFHAERFKKKYMEAEKKYILRKIDQEERICTEIILLPTLPYKVK